MSKRALIHRWRIAWVLTIGIELAVILAALGSGYFVYSLVRSTLIKQGISGVEVSARVAAAKLRSEYSSHPTKAPVEDLAYLTVSGDQYVLLTTSRGHLVGASGTRPPASPLGGWASVGTSGWLQFGSIPYLYASAPILVGSSNLRLIVVESQSHLASLLSTLRIALVLGGLVLIMSTLAAISVIVRRVADPLLELEEVARTVTLNVNEAAFASIDSRLAEVHSLEESFSNMLERLGRTQTREREFISNAAHSLRTPIHVIQGNIVSLGRLLSEDPDLARHDLKILTREVQAMATLVDRLLQLSRSESGVPAKLERFDLQLYLDRIAGTLRDSCMHHALLFSTHDLDARPFVTSDPVLLEVVLRVLIENADAYAEEDSAVTVYVATAENLSDIRIGVRNYCDPIPVPVLDELFERFYRNEQAASSEHYGLGLAIADSIVRRIGAKWFIESRPEGTIFALDIPSG